MIHLNSRRLLGSLGAATALSGVARAARAQEGPLKVAFVYIGPVGDFGWTYAHDQGRLAAEQGRHRRGRVVIAPFRENVPAEVASAATAIIDATKAGTYHVFAGPTHDQECADRPRSGRQKQRSRNGHAG